MPPHSLCVFFRRSACVLLAAGALLAVPALHAQMQTIAFTSVTPLKMSVPDASVSSSRIEDRIEDVDAPIPMPVAGVATRASQESSGHVLLHSIGGDIHVGVNGIGSDIALPIARRWNVRVGAQYMRYTGQFTSDGAQINADLKVGNGKAGVDWFPFYNGFHISPQVYFGVQTNVKGTVIVPAGSTITLDGSDYISSATDPLTGSAHITTRKVAPGLTVGWGDISPRGRKHWSFPVELGFYYIGQPKLDVTFQGSACDPTQPPDIGCQTVTTDPGFQSDLARFIARNNNNLKYAAFFPVAQFGVGYRF